MRTAATHRPTYHTAGSPGNMESSPASHTLPGTYTRTQVAGLPGAIEQFVSNNLAPPNACVMLERTLNAKTTRLAELCFSFIRGRCGLHASCKGFYWARAWTRRGGPWMGSWWCVCQVLLAAISCAGICTFSHRALFRDGLGGNLEVGAQPARALK